MAITSNILRHPRMRTNFLLACVLLLGLYMLLFETSRSSEAQQLTLNHRASSKDLMYGDVVMDDVAAGGGDVDNSAGIDRLEAEQVLQNSHKIQHVEYKSPFKGVLAPDHPGFRNKGTAEEQYQKQLDKYHRLWMWADKMVDATSLFPDNDDILQVLEALATAPIVSVDVHDVGAYESGTSEKWVVTLLGGQKAMMKLIWEEKGKMKKRGACNVGYEIASAEITAFHLHRMLGFRNTPPVSGRRVNLYTEILPVASARVAKQITHYDNQTCVTGKCYFCKTPDTMCRPDGIVEASITYWVPRHIKLYTYPPGYMPYSTPRMNEWGGIAFNNRSYCHKLRTKIEPYGHDQYYYDLFDFSVLDTLMYHYDSKHYVIQDHSEARGMTVRLDHGRAFCDSNKDDEHIFLAPVYQCCTLRRETWSSLEYFASSERFLSRRLLQATSIDPIAPVLDDVWYPVLQRRLDKIMHTVRRCAEANGGFDNILV